MSVTAPPPQQQQGPDAADYALLSAIVLVLASNLAADATASTITTLLAPLGVTATMVAQAMRLLGPGASATGGKAQAFTAAAEYPYRAYYLLNACRRLATGGSIQAEARNARLHLNAQRNRQGAAAAVDAVVARYGTTTLVWTAKMDDRTTAGCRKANGRVFTVDRPLVVEGRRCYPGQVHPFCRCEAKPAGMPDDPHSL